MFLKLYSGISSVYQQGVGCSSDICRLFLHTHTHAHYPLAYFPLTVYFALQVASTCYEHETITRKVYILSGVTFKEVMTTKCVCVCVCVSACVCACVSSSTSTVTWPCPNWDQQVHADRICLLSSALTLELNQLTGVLKLCDAVTAANIKFVFHHQTTPSDNVRASKHDVAFSGWRIRYFLQRWQNRFSEYCTQV